MVVRAEHPGAFWSHHLERELVIVVWGSDSVARQRLLEVDYALALGRAVRFKVEKLVGRQQHEEAQFPAPAYGSLLLHPAVAYF